MLVSLSASNKSPCLLIKEVTLDINSEKVKNMIAKTKAMKIPYPWTDQTFKKIGLYDMYIIDAVMESLEISAERDASKKLICINPKYEKMHKLLSKLINSCDTLESFENILKITGIPESSIVEWSSDGYIPDIRVLGPAEDCMSWLYTVCVKGQVPTPV